MVNGPIYDGNTLDEIYPRQCRMEPVLGTPMRPQANAGIVPVRIASTCDERM
jgi:hypothetical protein